MAHCIVLKLVELMHGQQLDGVDAQPLEIRQLLNHAQVRACTAGANMSALTC